VWSETVLHSFSGGSDGQYPPALVLSANGALYGTTYYGGSNNGGTVFELTPPAAMSGSWKETVLHSFSVLNGDGYDPSSTLVMGHGGVLYGTTGLGGSANLGTVFALSPPASPGGMWKEAVLYSFQGGLNNDGAYPLAGLVMGGDGSLYGTTWSGGLPIPDGLLIGYGTVFQLKPPAAAGGSWTETVLYEFAATGDGAFPYDSLIVGVNGSLYGTTGYGGLGGLHGNGTVFELTPPVTGGGAWTESALYSFTGQNGDGTGGFSGLVMDANGALYGTTSGGAAAGGTVFKLTPPSSSNHAWTETILGTFIGVEGIGPTGNLIFGPQGKLYGVAESGGSTTCFYECGTVFALQP
jgi:uncharacterized repeat protein (TIGR03803 family)